MFLKIKSFSKNERVFTLLFDERYIEKPSDYSEIRQIIVNTEVIDHLIISEKSFLSFADIGLMEELKKSIKYVPSYVLEQRIKKEASEIAKRKEKIEIAKAMKRAGEPADKIASFTGLPIEEVEKLRVRKQ